MRTASVRKLVGVLAVLGAAVLLVQLWAYAAWLFTSPLEPVRSSAPVPDEVVRNVRIAELSSIVGATAWLGFVAWDWRRRRTLTWPLLWTVAWASVFWQEPLVNVRTHTFSFNKEFHNLGDWTTYLPFVPDSYSPLPEALVLEGLVFLYLLPLLAVAVAAYMRLLRRHLRINSPVVLTLVAWASVVAFDMAFELQGIHQELLAYVEVGGPTLHAGEPGQWPLYEGLAIGAAWAFPGVLTFFVRDRASADGYPRWWPGRRGVVVTLLAAVGAVNLVFGLYNAGYVALMEGTPTEQPASLLASRRVASMS